MRARDLSYLKGFKKSGDGFSAKCPFHDDRHNSLSLSDGDDDRLLAHCHAGCENVFERLVATIPHSNGSGNSGRVIAEYDYRDEHGLVVYQVARTESKGFFQRRPDGQGGWINGLNGHKRLLYRYPELLKSFELKPQRKVFISEGEKDADRLASLGLVATTNSGGAGKWRDEHSAALRDRDVVIFPDNDDAGKSHALQVAMSLQGKAKSIKIVELPGLPEKGDVSDWLDAGGTLPALRELVNNAPEFQPTKAVAHAVESLHSFSFTTLDDLLIEPIEEKPFVVHRMLICGGFSIVAAKPKIGKSTLARNLAVCVANGAPFLGRATKQGKVIYLCLEEKRAEVADHFRRMGASGPNILIFTGATPKDVITALESAIEEHEPGLVIIDPLSRFIRVADFSSYGDVTLALEPLIDLARNSKCQTHIMALHHNGKGADFRENGDALLGSTAFFGMVDTLVTMRKREKARTVETTQRYGEDLPETIAHLDPVTGIVDGAGDMNEFTLNERKKAILESIGSEPHTEDAIKELAGGTNKGLTSKAVRALFEEGKLTRSGAGKKGDPFLYTIVLTSTAETERYQPKWADPERQAEWDRAAAAN